MLLLSIWSEKMNNLLEQYEKDQIARLTENKTIPDFRAGDTVSVSVRVIDGTTERLQMFEGVVIAKRNSGVNSSFVVRKVSYGEGVERRFMMYSPVVQKIEVVKRGVVRRAKLFYLRELSGKAARIREKTTYAKGAGASKKASPLKAEVAEKAPVKKKPSKSASAE
jgi:large subunit ribosomal protein L19